MRVYIYIHSLVCPKIGYPKHLWYVMLVPIELYVPILAPKFLDHPYPVPIKISKHFPRFWDYNFWWIHRGSCYPVAKNRKILGKEAQLLPQLFSFSYRERQRLRHRTWVSVDTRRLTQAVVVIWACLENGVPLSIPWFIIDVPIEWPFHVYTPFPDKPFEVLEQHRLVNVLNSHHPTIGEILQQIVGSNVHNPQNRTFSNRWTGVNKCSIQDMCWRSSFIMCSLGHGDQMLIG